MKSFGDSEKRTWWGLGCISALVVVITLFILSYRGEDQPNLQEMRDQENSTKIGLTRLVKKGEGSVVAEEAQFFDPTPLFLPTEWNTDQNILPRSILRDPSQMFPDFPSRLNFEEEALALEFQDVLQLPDNSSDTIAVLSGEMPFMGMGQGNAEIGVLEPRGSYISVKSADGQADILSEALPDAQPPEGNWRPIELLAAVNTAGLIGSLSFVERSGVEEVDLYFRNYLVGTLHLGERLAPGFYRIVVGP